jgi:2-polyprenyl-6-hydroxyphenyl methylase/3-demethylubiquinone-9 3-methyltransferase
MAQASDAPTTIDPKEAEHFGRMADDWWDPRGSSAMLHRLNPVRLAYIDVGCGAGLLAEPLARLGAEVTAIDAAPENIAAARRHAQGQGLEIDYRVGGVEALDGRFDLVTCLEVIEHVADVPAFVGGLAAALAEDGLLILSTPNRTLWSRVVMITIGEGSGRIPRGTHDWDKFLSPDELCAHLASAGLEAEDVTGLGWSLARGFCLTDDKSLNYLVTARRVKS